jgi:hypothetical protein
LKLTPGRDQHVLLLQQVERELLVVEVGQRAGSTPMKRIHRAVGPRQRR